MCSPSAPTPPDPNQVSAAQTRSNVDTARANAQLNRVNYYTPYGNLTYSHTGGSGSNFDDRGYQSALDQWNQSHPRQTDGGGQQIPIDESGMPTREQFTTPGVDDQWSAHVSLSPEQQALLDQDNRIKTQFGGMAEAGLSRVGSAMSQPFDTSHLTGMRDIPQGGGAGAFNASGLAPYQTTVGSRFGINNTGPSTAGIQMDAPQSRLGVQAGVGPQDFSSDRQRVEEALYSRLNPQLERDRSHLDQRLANQGIPLGSEAYREAIDESDRQANDARMQAILAGGQEQSRLAGLQLQQGQFANQAQNQDFMQRMAQGQFANQAEAQRYGQELAGLQFGNQAQQQDFTQNLQAGQFGNDARQRQFAEGLAGAQQGMQANQQNFAQQSTAAQLAQAQRQQQLQEQAYLRQLPLNELNALRSGAQVTNPTFSTVPQTNVAPTDTSGNAYRSYQGQVNNYSQQVGANNNLLNGLFSLGSAALPFML